jgi:hypothetical protein
MQTMTAASASSRNARIPGLALPIVGGMLSQNPLNRVDTAMVGTLGNEALTAIGMSINVLLMCLAVIMGNSTCWKLRQRHRLSVLCLAAAKKPVTGTSTSCTHETRIMPQYVSRLSAVFADFGAHRQSPILAERAAPATC